MSDANVPADGSTSGVRDHGVSSQLLLSIFSATSTPCTGTGIEGFLVLFHTVKYRLLVTAFLAVGACASAHVCFMAKLRCLANMAPLAFFLNITINR